MTEARTTYWFGPLERRGLLGTLRVAPAACLAVAVLAAIALIDAVPSAGGLAGALTMLATGLALAFAPLAGRSPAGWGPTALAFGARRLLGRSRFVSPVARAGTRVRGLGAGSGPTLEPPGGAVPPQLGQVRIIAAEHRGHTIGALSEQSGGRLTAVLACRVPAFALLDADAQERRLARWGNVLSGAGATAIRRLQWIERTAPASGDELGRWLGSERDPSVAPRGTPMIESYLELIGSTARASQAHEVLIAVQVDGARRRERRGPAVRSLVEETERVARGLQAAEVTVLGALGPAQLARSLRTAFDPFARAELARLDAADQAREGLAERGAWPLGCREAWDHYQTDGAVHATYWIGAWPRIEVSPLFLSPLLGSSGAVRAVAVTFEPLSSARSTREIEAAVTQDRADRELRARFGQSETARQRQAREATARRESELAAGHGEVRLSGFVTVSGRDPDDLRRACAEVLDQSARAHLELHRLYGQQAAAFAFTLPLGRGLR